MKLDKKAYEDLRAEMRQELARLCRADALRWEIIAARRRISRLDMAWIREEDWHDTPAGRILG